jgi:dephospho-CoA kinase
LLMTVFFLYNGLYRTISIEKGAALQQLIQMTGVIALVGMAGAGKSEVASIFQKCGFQVIHFGDVTLQELKNLGLEYNEQNERHIRELLRSKYGMAAYAILNLPRIDSALESSDTVVDGLYSWEEYLLLKKKYSERLKVVAVWAPPGSRYQRLGSRPTRPLSAVEAASRDTAEIEQLNKGGPIAMADFTITNEASLKELVERTEELIRWLR